MANLENFQHFSTSSGSIPFSVVRMPHIGSSIPQLFYSAVKGQFLQKSQVQFLFLLLECLISEAVYHNYFIQQSNVNFFKNSCFNSKHYILYLKQKSYQNRSANKTTKIMPSSWPIRRVFNILYFMSGHHCCGSAALRQFNLIHIKSCKVF